MHFTVLAVQINVLSLLLEVVQYEDALGSVGGGSDICG
jgi:hypothetical protein